MKLSKPYIKILELVKKQEMSGKQIASTTEMDEKLVGFYTTKLERDEQVVGNVKEEREGDKPVLRRYYSITEKGLGSLSEVYKNQQNCTLRRCPF
jgi:DNA-binding PadR family transcriptional regulator